MNRAKFFLCLYCSHSATPNYHFGISWNTIHYNITTRYALIVQICTLQPLQFLFVNLFLLWVGLQVRVSTKILTLCSPIFPFDTPENRKPLVFLCFQGDQKETGKKGLNRYWRFSNQVISLFANLKSCFRGANLFRNRPLKTTLGGS